MTDEVKIVLEKKSVSEDKPLTPGEKAALTRKANKEKKEAIAAEAARKAEEKAKIIASPYEDIVIEWKEPLKRNQFTGEIAFKSGSYKLQHLMNELEPLFKRTGTRYNVDFEDMTLEVITSIGHVECVLLKQREEVVKRVVYSLPTRVGTIGELDMNKDLF